MTAFRPGLQKYASERESQFNMWRIISQGLTQLPIQRVEIVEDVMHQPNGCRNGVVIQAAIDFDFGGLE